MGEDSYSRLTTTTEQRLEAALRELLALDGTDPTGLLPEGIGSDVNRAVLGILRALRYLRRAK